MSLSPSSPSRGSQITRTPRKAPPSRATPPTPPAPRAGSTPASTSDSAARKRLRPDIADETTPQPGTAHTEARVTESGWRDFLDKEVTPRFPDGLSVFDCYGQWQGKTMSRPERLRSKVLVIDYPDTPANRAKIDAIRTAWKKRTGDQSVLNVTQPAEVSF